MSDEQFYSGKKVEYRIVEVTPGTMIDGVLVDDDHLVQTDDAVYATRHGIDNFEKTSSEYDLAVWEKQERSRKGKEMK